VIAWNTGLTGRIGAIALATSCAVLLVSACELLPVAVPVGVPGQVDVTNHADRPMLVTITSANGGSAWRLAPGAGTVVRRGVPVLDGTIELIDPADCTTYDSGELTGSSLTIVVEQVKGPAFDARLQLEPAARLLGPVNLDYFGGCSG
jgi:hypothetical protein